MRRYVSPALSGPICFQPTPGKPLALIAGKSMIQRVYEQCMKPNCSSRCAWLRTTRVRKSWRFGAGP